MDIDDILAEVDGDVVPQETRDLHDLTRAWINERSSPEVLPWPESLMERMMDRIRQQVGYIEAYRYGLESITKRTLFWAPADRSGGNADGRHGPENQFPPYNHRDRAREVQVPGAVFPADKDSQGLCFSRRLRSPRTF